MTGKDEASLQDILVNGPASLIGPDNSTKLTNSIELILIQMYNRQASEGDIIVQATTMSF